MIFNKLQLKNNWIYLILIIHFLLLLNCASELSISFKEAQLYYFHRNIIHFFGEIFTSIFSHNDIALRITPITLIVFSTYLHYKISKYILKYEIDVFISVVIFMFLAGVNSAALTFNISSYIIFLTYLFLYLYIFKHKYPNYYIYILFLMYISDGGFLILFLSLSIYSYYTKNKLLNITSTILFVLSYFTYDFTIDGIPRNYFLEIFGMFAGIITPFLFLYMIYAIYRLGVIGKKDIIWYISATTLIVALLLSLRQKIDIVYFAPFLIISIPIILRLFLNSYRVRLKQFRTKYKLLASLILFGIIINGFMIFFNKYLFIIVNNYSQNFAYRNYFAKELASKLKHLNIHAIKCDNYRLQPRLKFYGISQGYNLLISQNPKYRNKTPKQIITIKYFNKPIIIYYLYNLKYNS